MAEQRWVRLVTWGVAAVVTATGGFLLGRLLATQADDPAVDTALASDPIEVAVALAEPTSPEDLLALVADLEQIGDEAEDGNAGGDPLEDADGEGGRIAERLRTRAADASALLDAGHESGPRPGTGDQGWPQPAPPPLPPPPGEIGPDGAVLLPGVTGQPEPVPIVDADHLDDHATPLGEGWFSFDFHDPCADEPEDDDCPEDGVPGTILPIDLHHEPEPFRINSAVYPRAVAHCTFGEPQLNVAQFVLLANNPGTLTIEYSPTGATSPSSTVTVEVSDAERDRYVLRQLEGWYGSSHGMFVNYCVDVPALVDRDASYELRVRGVDDVGQTAEATIRNVAIRGGAVPEGADRPPTGYTVVGGTSMTLMVPSTSVSAREARWPSVRLLPQNLPDVEPMSCSDAEPLVTRGNRTHEVEFTRGGPLPDDLLDSDEWIWGERWTDQLVGNPRLEPGVIYHLCIWWLGAGTRSFDPWVVHDREMHEIHTVDRWRYRFRVVGYDLERPAAADAFQGLVRAWPHGCTVSFPSRDIDAERPRYEARAASRACDLGPWGHGVTTEMEVTDGDGNSQVWSIPTPRAYCPPGVESADDCRAYPGFSHVTLRLPGPALVRGMCGTSPLNPTCDPPHEDEFVGWVHLEVEAYHGPRSGQQRTTIQAPASFPAGPSARRLEGDVPDWDRNGLRMYARDRTVHVEIEFDRPLTLEAFIEGDQPPCLREGPGSASSPSQGTRHHLVFEGLCYGTSYGIGGQSTIGLVTTDHTGRTTAFSGYQEADQRFPPFLLDVKTRGIQGRLELEWTIDAVGDGYGSLATTSGEAWIDHQTVGTYRAPTTPQLQQRPLCIAEGRERMVLMPPETVEIGEVVHVRGTLRGSSWTDSRCASRYGEPTEITVAGQVTLDELLAGPVAISTAADEDRRLTVVVVFTPDPGQDLP